MSTSPEKVSQHLLLPVTSRRNPTHPAFGQDSTSPVATEGVVGGVGSDIGCLDYLDHRLGEMPVKSACCKATGMTLDAAGSGNDANDEQHVGEQDRGKNHGAWMTKG